MNDLIIASVSICAVLILTLPILNWARKKNKIKKEQAEKDVNSMLEKLNLSIKCSNVGNNITGIIKGYSFQIYINYHNEIPIQYMISLNGNFPKQKQFMFDYPKFGNGITWKGKSLCKNFPISASHEDIKLTLNEMVIFAKDIENNNYQNSLSANEANHKSTQYILYFLCLIASIFLCLDIYSPSNSKVEGILKSKASTHFGKSSSYTINIVDANSVTYSFDVTPPTFEKLKKGSKITVIQSSILHRTTHVISQNGSYKQYFLQSNIIMFSITLTTLVCALGGVFIGFQRLFSNPKIS